MRYEERQREFARAGLIDREQSYGVNKESYASSNY
jgi:hypothetical protein